MTVLLKRYRAVLLAGVVLLVGSGLFASVEAGDKEKESGDGSLRVQDLPKPIPKVMEKIQEVGNEAGKGITKAGSAIGEAFNKAVKKGKEKSKE